MADKFEPYVGPRPFGRGDSSRFFGRIREANELLSLIISHPITLLYAQSGAGKTSLLNAKVIPMLEEKSSQIFGPARVGGDLPQGITNEDVNNIYIFNALLSLKGELNNLQSLGMMSFAQFMKAQPSASQTIRYSRRVVIFDQFEEIFITHPERWKDRESFFDSVGLALEQDPSLRVVFAIREEFIARMDPFAPILPEKLRTRFRLERLRESAALLAVTGPLKGTEYTFAAGAAEKLVKGLQQVPVKSATGTVNVLSEFIEPVQLQVVCKNMWQSLPPNVRVIDEKYIEDFGDADGALAAYYDDCVVKAVELSNIREGILRRWFERKLITPDRTRGTAYQDTSTTGGLKNETVSILEDFHLVRPELRGGASWYELTHDRLIAPIIKSNENWLNKRSEGRLISQRLEGRAEEWANTLEEQRTKYLLIEEELRETKQWLKSPNAEELGASELLSKFVQASEIAVERKHAEAQAQIAKKFRQQRNILVYAIAITFITFLGALAATVYIVTLQNRKREDERRAVMSTRSELNGRVAKYLSGIPPNEVIALKFGLAALNVDKDIVLPEPAVDGLRAAVTVIGNSTWLQGMTSSVNYVNFSLSGEYAYAYGPSQVCVWETRTGKLLFSNSLKEGAEAYNSVIITPNGRRLITVTQPSLPQGKSENDASSTKEQSQYKIEILDVLSADNKQPFSRENIKVFQILNDYRHVFIYTSNNDSFVLDAETNNQYRIQLSADEAEKMLSAVISPDEMHLIVAGEHGDLKVWDLSNGQLIKTLLTKRRDTVFNPALALSVQAKRLIFVIDYGQGSTYTYHIYVWDLKNYKLLKDVEPNFKDDLKVSGLTIDGKKLSILIGNNSNPLEASSWEVEKWKPIASNRKTSVLADDKIWPLTDGMSFMDKNNTNQLEFEEYDTGKVSALLDIDPTYGTVSDMDLSPTGQVIVSVNRSTIFVRNVGSEPLNVQNASVEQLRSIGCEQLLRQQSQLDEVSDKVFNQVFQDAETICRQ